MQVAPAVAARGATDARRASSQGGDRRRSLQAPGSRVSFDAWRERHREGKKGNGWTTLDIVQSKRSRRFFFAVVFFFFFFSRCSLSLS